MRAAVFLFLLFICGMRALGATASEDSTSVQMRRGTSTVPLDPVPQTLAECEQRKAALIALDAETRFSGTATYSCIETRRSVVTFSPNLPPPPPPPPPPVEPPPAAPTLSLVGVAQRADGKWNVAMSWTAIAGAASYSVERCTGENCSNFSAIKTVSGTAYTNTSLLAGTTYKYRVRLPAGAYSNVLTAVTQAAAPPPPPATGSATLRWTPPTENTNGSALTNLAGYRIMFGTGATALLQSLEVASPGQTSYIVTGLPVGTWYFAVSAYSASGAESARSNIAVKAVQ